MAEVLPIRPRNDLPKRSVKVPQAPKHLSSSAKKLWRDIISGWHLDAAAMDLFTRALESRDRYDAAAAQISRDGPTVTSSSGMLRTHPAHAVLRDNLREYRQLMRQLNLETDEL